MSRRVRILDEAANEATEAAAWYERQRAGLGEEFQRAIDAALDLLEEDIVPLNPVPGAAGERGAKRIISQTLSLRCGRARPWRRSSGNSLRAPFA